MMEICRAHLKRSLPLARPMRFSWHMEVTKLRRGTLRERLIPLGVLSRAINSSTTSAMLCALAASKAVPVNSQLT
jgi:hypothetical protein